MLRKSIAVAMVLAFGAGADGDVVRTTGYGTVIGGDTAGARDEAIIDARTRALEEVAGVFIDAETILENELILEATVRSTTSGLVSDYAVVNEGVNADGLYEVIIEAEVAPGEYKEKIGREITRNASVVVMIPEDNMGREIHNPAVENEIVSMLVGAGFTVYDRDQLKRIRDRKARVAALEGSPEASQEIGLEFLSNLVVTGRASARFSQETGGIVSARASASVRMVEAETGLILANRRVDRAKGFDLSAEEAGYKALEEAANELAKSVLGWMSSEYLAARMKEITVEVRGLADMNAYRTVGNLLESMRWVEDVEEQGYGPGGGFYTVRYPEKPVYLASKLDRAPQVKLIEYGPGRIVLRSED
jgi:hypothetical protein